MSTLSLRYISAEGKPLSKKAIKKQQKDAEKSKKKAETAARLVSRAYSLSNNNYCLG